MKCSRVTAELKVRANRLNARAGTGPKTAGGRGRAAQNARRHGLSVPVLLNAGLSEEVEALAREIAGVESTVRFYNSHERSLKRK